MCLLLYNSRRYQWLLPFSHPVEYLSAYDWVSGYLSYTQAEGTALFLSLINFILCKNPRMTQVSVIPIGFLFTSEAYTSLSTSIQRPSHSCCVLTASLALSQIQQIISRIWFHLFGFFSETNIYVLSLFQLPSHLRIFFFILCCLYCMEKLISNRY